jgi:hypothetical protein
MRVLERIAGELSLEILGERSAVVGAADHAKVRGVRIMDVARQE